MLITQLALAIKKLPISNVRMSGIETETVNALGFFYTALYRSSTIFDYQANGTNNLIEIVENGVALKE